MGQRSNGPWRARENLRNSKALMRLNMVIARNLLEKFAKMKRNQRLSVQRIHLVSQINRMEPSGQIEGRLLTGREMMRTICAWCSV
eukprot:5270594-Pyramimonas_sp.AAC.1